MLRTNPIAEILARHQPDIDRFAEVYRGLHRNPELSCCESNTARYVAEYLEKLGITVHRNIGGHGVAGVLENGKGGTILLRSELDAVPVLEETGLPYASQVYMDDAEGNRKPVMHACGHDVHIASLMGAADMLVAAKNDWHGTIVFVFQPNEELAGGAKSMVEDGLYERVPKPDVLLAQHVFPTRSGTVAMRAGVVLSTAFTAVIRLFGRGGHGSTPQ